MVRSSTRAVNWAVEVASRMRGAGFPLEEDEARDRLRGVRVEGRSINDFMDNIHFPVPTPADLLHDISKQTGVSRGEGGGSWSVTVAKAMKNVPFPLSKEQAKEHLHGIDVQGRDIAQLLPRLKYPIDTPAALLDQIAKNLE